MRIVLTMAIAVVLGTAVAAPRSALAVEPDGTITATIDGEAKTWYILRREFDGKMRSQSEWGSPGFNFTAITLFGHTSPTAMEIRDALTVEITLSETGKDPNVVEAEIYYLLGDFNNMYSTQGRENLSIDVTEATVENDALTVSGTFSGTLTPGPLNKSDDGPAEIIVQDGSFEATVYEAEGQ